MPPRLVSHYRVVRRLGAGGMGEVYLAHDTQLERPVALKLLPPGLAQDDSRRKRFLAEAKAASALNHSNVCIIHEVGQTADGQPFIAMEYLEGQTLEVLTRHRRLELREIVGIGVQVADALEAARQNQVVHRDIKPGNIVVLSPKSEVRSPNLQVKVLDFGLAKRLDEAGEAPTLTQEGTIVGTPNYLSPELALGREVDSGSDLFSLGVVLYELAAGRNPFAGASFGETVNSILNKNPDSLKSWNPTVTGEFERIVRKCLEKDPANRYGTPAQLRDDLAKVQAGLQKPRSSSQKLWAVAAIVVALGVTVLGALWLMRSQPTTGSTATVQLKSIAVLPFVNMSADKADEYLSDGISEDLCTALTQVKELRVPAWRSCLALKGKTEDIRKVGRQFKVAMVLAGSVTKAANKLRINAQLSDVVNGTQLWAMTYDREMADILEIRSDIARQLASALKAQLGLDEAQRLVKQPTINAEAYRLYLQGRYLWNRRTGDAIQRAIGFFNQAIAKDPAYALAHAGLADCYILLPEYANRPPRDAFPRAKAAALEALKWDSNLAEPHAALAYVKAYLDWDWSGAEAEFRRAIALNPNYATAHHWLAVLLETMRRYDDELAEMELARALDPDSPIINSTYGCCLCLGRKPDLAVEVLKKQIALAPSFVGAHNSLGLVYAYQGKWPEAIAEFETIRRLDENGTSGLDMLGLAYARAGKTAEAQNVLGRLLELQRQGLDLRIYVATVLHGLGDDEGALKSLEDGLAEHALGLDWVNSQPYLKDLRVHPRAQAILRKMNLAPEPATSLTTPDPKSVAVLPFANLSSDKEYEYLSVGLSEDLSIALTPVKELHVAAWPLCLALKGETDTRKIGEKLHVATVLAGSVTRADSKLRVNAQLSDVANGFQLWAMKYDSEMTNILEIRSDIVQRVVTALKVQLGLEETRALSKKPTENVEAYNFYLLGRSHWGRYSADGWSRALDYFNQAIAKDPTYALAYAGKADAYDWLAMVGMPAREAFEKGKLAAQRALELDDSLAEAHAAMGNVRFMYDWDWAAAEKEYQRALQINPNLALARDAYGSFLATQGRFDEAIREQQRAIEQDPFSSYLTVDLGWIFYPARQYERAIEQARKGLDLDQNFGEGHRLLGWCYVWRGQTKEALAEMLKLRSLDDNPWNAAGLAYVYATSGKTNEALQIMQAWDTTPQRRHVAPSSRALVYLGLGDTNSALTWLEQACEVKDSLCPYANVDPVFDSVRSHPRFQALLRKMNLVPVSTTNAPPAVSQKSVAVLPFVNLSADKNDECLSDGMTEELLNALTKVKGLRVPGRSSSFAFKGRNEEDIFRKVGEQLHVNAVLEGSVRKAGNQLRITAQLISVADGFHLWSEIYDRDMTNIFAIQSDIAQQVVAALKVQLGVEETHALAKKPTDNLEAYALCMQGRVCVNEGTSASFTNAVKLFQQAIALDPGYALAYSGLADAYNMISDWLLPPGPAVDAARKNAETAIRLDDSLAQPHVALSYIKGTYDWDHKGCEQECERAIALAPNLAEVHRAYGYHYLRMKRYEDARRAMKRAWQLDPLSPILNDCLANVEFGARDYPKALELSRTTVSQFPDSFWGHFRLALVNEQLGRYEDAISEMARARSIDNTPDLIARHAHIYASAGQPAKALQLMRELEDKPKRAYVSPTVFAWVHLGLGRTNEAIIRLQEAVELRDGFLSAINSDPYYDPIRADPRFIALLKKVGLPP